MQETETDRDPMLASGLLETNSLAPPWGWEAGAQAFLFSCSYLHQYFLCSLTGWQATCNEALLRRPPPLLDLLAPGIHQSPSQWVAWAPGEGGISDKASKAGPYHLECSLGFDVFVEQKGKTTLSFQKQCTLFRAPECKGRIIWPFDYVASLGPLSSGSLVCIKRTISKEVRLLLLQ